MWTQGKGDIRFRVVEKVGGDCSGVTVAPGTTHSVDGICGEWEW